MENLNIKCTLWTTPNKTNIMKVLSIKQPWAFLLASGIKDVENRVWKTKYRGMVLIHSPKKTDFDHPMIQEFIKNQAKRFDWSIAEMEAKLRCYASQTSAIIGAMYVMDCVKGSRSQWAFPDQWNWIIRQPYLFSEPITNVSGKLHLWNYEDDGRIKKILDESPIPFFYE